jgi:hypothetical protein
LRRKKKAGGKRDKIVEALETRTCIARKRKRRKKDK